MAYKKRFNSSQNAHKRLASKHKRLMQNNDNYDKHFIKMSYHNYCFNKQKDLKRVFSQQEKKKAYDNVISTFYS